jgi:3-deoxy-D-manno-octulosonate 8-phosphate phosphatase KdsC-like HAD superfamily phosphatase
VIRIKRFGAAKQVHEDSDNSGGFKARAVIDDHGYSMKITIDLNYNVLTTRQINNAHKRIEALLDSALTTGNNLREYNPAMFDTDDLFAMQPDAAVIDMGDHA